MLVKFISVLAILTQTASAAVMSLACPGGYKLCAAGTTPYLINGTATTVSNCIYDSCPQIQVLGTDVTFSNVSFINSVNPLSVTTGGAIQILPNANNVIVLRNVLFNNNVLGSGSFGGGLYILGNTTVPVSLTNMTFTNNVADRGSGAYIKFANVNVNGVYGANGLANVHGGSVYFYGCTVITNNFNLINNQAPNGYGGDIYFYSCYSVNSNYKSSWAVSAGGGSIIANGGLFNLKNAVFLYATSSGEGGAILAPYSEFRLDWVTVRHSSGTDGGAIIAYGAPIAITNIEVTNCTGSNTGGALYFYASDPVLINAYFYLNWGYFGGDIMVDGARLNARNTTHVYSGAVYGGAVYAYPDDSTAAVSMTNVVANSAYASYGGFLYNEPNTMVQFNGVSASLLYAVGGGFIYGDTMNSSSFFQNLNFANNYATKGGSFYTLSSVYTVTNLISKSPFAATSGGDFWVSGGNLAINQYNVTNQKAINGSAIFATANATVSVMNGGCSGGAASSAGSCYYQSGGSLTLSNLVFFNNSANYGSLFTQASAKVNANWLVFQRNTGNVTFFPGAGMYLDNSVSNMNQIYFAQNYQKDFTINGGNFTCSYCNNLLLNVFCVYNKLKNANVMLSMSTCDTVLRSTTTTTTTTAMTTMATTTSGAVSGKLFSPFLAIVLPILSSFFLQFIC